MLDKKSGLKRTTGPIDLKFGVNIEINKVLYNPEYESNRTITF